MGAEKINAFSKGFQGALYPAKVLGFAANGISQLKTSLPKNWKSLTLTGVGVQKKHSLLNRICIFICLKKIASILLLSLMVFNLAGYRWLFTIIEEKAATRLENKITTDQYSDDQLVEICIPLDMPYYSDKGYENIYGETDWNGQHYRYVKRKISGNTLYLLCIPDTEKTAITSVKNEFTKAVNDVPANKQGSHQKNTLIKLLTTEFKITDLLLNEAFISALSNSFSNKKSLLTNLFIPLTDAQPPEVA